MNIYKKLVHGCEEATLLAIRSKEEKLPVRKKMQLHFHLWVCSCCSNFVKQSERIDSSMQRYFQEAGEHPPFLASEALKSSLREKLH